MREIRAILYYRFDKEISAERTALSLKISKGSVINTVHRFNESGLKWPLSDKISDTELENKLYPQLTKKPNEVLENLPTISYLEKELSRKHVTLQCLYEEYDQNNPIAVSRASFYRYFKSNRPKSCSMPMSYKGGDLLYVDYSGDSLTYVDIDTGEVIKTELFCCCWGASSFSYAEATGSQKKEDFVYSHPRSFKYFSVVPHGLVPDNLKSGVKTPSRYDPIINPLYEEMARHYNTAVLPARVRKPKDKAKVESAVLHIQRYILAHLRNKQFFSLLEMNTAIRELLEKFNDRPMKDYGNQTRRERFELLDKPHAQKLPTEPFRVVEVKLEVLVGKNYHIRYDDHFYSAPFENVGKRVKVRRNGGMIEIIHDNKYLARHLYSTRKYKYTTKLEHMPKSHQYVKGLTPGWIMAQAAKIGQDTVNVVSEIMRRTEHVQQGFNAALGVLSFTKVYPKERVEKASSRCIHYNMISYRALKSVLEKNLDLEPLENQNRAVRVVNHLNLRSDYK